MAMTIPGSGKTTLKNALGMLFKFYNFYVDSTIKHSNNGTQKIKLLQVCNDDIRLHHMKERMTKNNETKDEAFEKSRKSANKAFEDRVMEIVDEIIVDTKHTGFAVYYDKNVLPNQFRNIEITFTEIREKLSEHHITMKIICMVPNCLHPAKDSSESSKTYNPFSYNYLMQTYMRCHLRTDHPTITADDPIYKPISISCNFFKQFNCVEFKKGNTKCLAIDHKNGQQMEFDDFVYVNFTKESSQFGPPEAFVQAADAILNHKSAF